LNTALNVELLSLRVVGIPNISVQRIRATGPTTIETNGLSRAAHGR
jgi:hypothetical protein